MLAVMRQPALDRFEGVGPQAHEAPLSLDAPLDQPGTFQHLQVPGDRLGTDGEPRRHVADAELARRHEPFDNSPPDRIGESSKQIVQLRCTRGHHEAPYSTDWLINTLVG